MDRESKLRRINEFRRRKSYCSASVLAQILTDVKQNGLPDLTDRHAMRKARDFITSNADGGYGPIIRHIECHLITGGTKSLPIADPFASLAAAIEQCASFRVFLKTQLNLHPPSPEKPWNIILYSDEVTPGNPLSVSNTRKFQSVYLSFLEFGVNALSHEEAWFAIMTEFSTAVNTLHATLSQVFGAIVKSFFQPEGFHMMDSGMTILLDGDYYRLFAKIGVVLQDGGAHKVVWQSRGDGASKFCLLCKNIFTDASKVVCEDGTHLLRSNQIKLNELVAATDAELRTNARYLERMSTELGPEDFAQLQQAIGLTYAKHALLLDRDLDRLIQPTAVYMHDYMHALFADGILNLCTYLCFEHFIQAGRKTVYAAFSEFLSNWKYPGRLHGDHLSEIFGENRRDKHRNAKHIKCQASDMLSVLGVLSLFVQTVLRPLNLCEASCRAMLSCIELALLVVATARIDVSPARLLGVVHRFLEDFTNAFGFDWLIPKAHWLLHLPESLKRFGRLLNCFALERKHKVPKRYATDLTNISKYASKSLLTEVVCQHLSNLGAYDFNTDVRLINGRPAPKHSKLLLLTALGIDDDGSDVLTATTARFSPLATCQKNDVVLLDTEHGLGAGRVQLHCGIHGECVSLVQTFTLVRRVPGTALAVWRVNDGPHECWETKAILAAVEYCVYPDGNVGTLLPIEHA